MSKLTPRQLEALALGRQKGLVRKRPSGLKYKIKKENKGWFKKGNVINPFPKGHVPWNKGKKGLTAATETSFKKGDTPWNKGIEWEGMLWKKHPNFKTGRWRIRNRVKRLGIKPICNRCGKVGTFGRKIHTHHIDENKENNLMENIEILCSKCHANHHKNWEKRK